jgi:hypothetical protein
LYPGKEPAKINARLKYIAYKLLSMDSSNAYYWWQSSFYCKPGSQQQGFALQKAVALQPHQAVFWNYLAGYYADNKNITKFVDVMELAKPKDGDRMDYWYQQYAFYYKQLGKKEEAKKIKKLAKENGIDIVY